MARPAEALTPTADNQYQLALSGLPIGTYRMHLAGTACREELSLVREYPQHKKIGSYPPQREICTYLCIGKSERPAPAELPQDRKVARVGG